MKHITALFAFSLFIFTSSAAIPLRWTIETSRAVPAQFEAYQGETLTFEAALQSYGKPLEAPANYSLYWQTNGMGSTYWSLPCTTPNSNTLNSNNSNTLYATWSPTNDVGAKVYNCFIGQPGTIYHAAFQLRLRPSPGALPNELPLPQKVIDFAKVTVLNPPWSGGGGGVDTNAVREIVTPMIGDATNVLNETVLKEVAESYPTEPPEWSFTNFPGHKQYVNVTRTYVQLDGEEYWCYDFEPPGMGHFHETVPYSDDYYFTNFTFSTTLYPEVIESTFVGTRGLYFERKTNKHGLAYLENVDDAVRNKADRATTLSGYGITDGAGKTDIAGKRDLTNNVCMADERLDRFVIVDYGGISDDAGESQPYFSADFGGLIWVFPSGKWYESHPGTSMSDTKVYFTETPPTPTSQTFLAVRPLVCVSNELFVTHSFVTNAVNAAKYVPNATDLAFSNAVLAVELQFATNEVTSATYIMATNVLAQLGFDDNAIENLPGGKIYGSIGALLAALAAAIALLRKKTAHIESDGTADDDFANDLLGKQVANVKANTASLAAAYSDSATYAVGDAVTHDGKLYKCAVAITTAEAWTPAHWTETTVANLWNNADTTSYGGQN